MVDDNQLIHYGTPRHSGRYPWGSGENVPRSGRDFLGYVDGLRKSGLSDPEIAKGLGINTTQLRAAKAIAKNETRKADAAQALRLKDKGLSNVAIGERMGINESSVRSLTDPAMAERRDVLQTTADFLKERVGKDGYLDIGVGTERHLDISETKLSTAVAMLKQEGYEVHNIQVDQLGTGNKTTIRVLAPPGTTYADIVRNPTNIKSVAGYSDDGGRTIKAIVPPKSIDSKRVAIRYAEQGGANADGVVYVRRGVDDVSLGNSRYAQVRIAVDGTHYLKGMAMYKDDLPPGVDLMFNTNKRNTGNKLDAMKSLKTDDEENPFGATVHQRYYKDAKGKDQLSVMNIVNEEGDWSDWSRSLSSQMLSKQSTTLAKKQLDLGLGSRKDELAEINALTNPVVKKKLLDTFADGADSAAVHLKAAALPHQRTSVILPIEGMKPTEVYAPSYLNGQRVVLIRFPHGGTFEIPELVVNNKNVDAKKTIGNAIDAIGIHPKVAERLSGADFDGDTVLVIPNNRQDIKTSSPLSGLKDFDPKTSFAPYDGMRTMDGGTYNAATKSVDYGGKKPSGRIKQQQMGDVSNLITDMTIKGAKPEELARAVRHSMVVIDAEKHKLNYKQSYVDNGIASLKEKYQGRGPTGRLAGASTLISRSGTNSKVRIPDRIPRPAAQGGPIDKATGKKVYVDTNESYVDKTTGNTVVKTKEIARLANVEDAHTLSSGTPIERIYADHSNSLKALANSARKESVTTGGLTYSPTANKTYAHQVALLKSKLNTALKNKPLERQAQLLANTMVDAKRRDNPTIEGADLKKIKGQALVTARERVGAKKQQITITPEEWEAIQAGAISSNMLSKILDNSDLERVKELATPRATLKMTPTKVDRARLMLNSGYTNAEVADALGVAVSTLYESLAQGE
jgi:DNA-binding CsgD family transcriptional regulator